MARAVYPGSFDPITNGHVGLIKKAANIFDRVIVGIGVNPDKKGLFTPQERLDLVYTSLPAGLDNVVIYIHAGLMVKLCRRERATVILRGLRAVSDFDAEFAMGMTNQRLDSSIQTMFMMPDPEHQFTSSSMVRQLAKFREPVDQFVPPPVVEALKIKFSY